MPTVLIVGGGGFVGSRIAPCLATPGEIRLIIAGRDRQRAQSVAAAVGAKVRPLDLSDHTTWGGALAGADLVIVCMDQEDARFAQCVLENGIHYIDVTAGDALFRAVEAIPSQSVHGTAVLSVGVAPGITNLLAVDAASRLDEVHRVDISLLLGLGDSHGRAAVDWTVRQLFHERREPSIEVEFGPPWGNRRAHWMDFADQHALVRTGLAPATATRFAFESQPVTAFLFALGTSFAGNQTMMRLASMVSPILSFGSDAWVAVAVARGTKDGQEATATARFAGRREADVTARVAAIVTRAVLERERQNGVFHIHQLFEPRDVLEMIARETDGVISR